jgi:hypothetical protein
MRRIEARWPPWPPGAEKQPDALDDEPAPVSDQHPVHYEAMTEHGEGLEPLTVAPPAEPLRQRARDEL